MYKRQIWINQHFHKRRQATKEGAENNPNKQQEENILIFFLKQEVIKH